MPNRKTENRARSTGSDRTGARTAEPRAKRAARGEVNRNRPSEHELGGVSEYEASAATGAAALANEGPEDPVRSIGSEPQGGPPRREDLSVDPEDLGVEFLKGAVQDPRPLEAEDAELHEEFEPSVLGEALTDERGDEDDAPPPLTTFLPDGTEQERDRSNRALEEVKRQIRRRRQAGKPPHLH